MLKPVLPPDIENKINKLFTTETDRSRVKELMVGLWSVSINVGPAQLARSILTLSNGSLEKIIEVTKDFYGDPRDVIMMAENKLGNPGHYFNEPFEEDD